jgi:hypothetical protein
MVQGVGPEFKPSIAKEKANWGKGKG